VVWGYVFVVLMGVGWFWVLVGLVGGGVGCGEMRGGLGEGYLVGVCYVFEWECCGVVGRGWGVYVFVGLWGVCSCRGSRLFVDWYGVVGVLGGCMVVGMWWEWLRGGG
jgi:hypothetical protein